MGRPLLCVNSLISAVLLVSSTAQAASPPLSTLLIQRSDLRAGYGKALASGYSHSPRYPNGSSVSRRALTIHGYVISYTQEFEDLGKHPAQHVTAAIIQEGVDQYRDNPGARWGFKQLLRARYPQEKSLANPKVGDEAAAFSAVLPEPPGRAAEIFFRRGRYVVDMFYGARQGPLQSATLALARLVDSRIQKKG